MNDHNIIFADPWLQKATKKTRLPKDALFACSYDLHVTVDTFEEAAFFRRTETSDELWRATGFDLPIVRGIADGYVTPNHLGGKDVLSIGCVFAAAKKGEESSSCLALLDRLFRAYVGFCTPQRFLAGGIISESAYNNLVKRIDQELEENAQKARENETEIIKVARELGLYPRPTGKGITHWWASCPSIRKPAFSHPLYIDAAENYFGCGWCKRKGGVEELRAFVMERTGGKQRGERADDIEELVKRAHRGEYAEELVELGYRFEKGRGFDQDYGKAMEFYELASAEGNGMAMNNIGWLYLNGLGVRRNLKAAVEWFEKAAQDGNATAMVNLGNICEGYGLVDGGSPDYKGAMKWYTKAAQWGDPKAKLNRGNLYHYGHGVRKNYRKAAEIYKELAMSGRAEGYFYMGLYFQNGFHFKQNYDAARYFYEMGAAGNDAPSMMNLGVMYGKGLGVKVDHQKALHWYMQAGEGGDPLAYVNIGWIFEKELDIERDYKQAVHWYEKGAAAGEPHAMNNLGAMYERGLGVEKDQKEAEYWYAKAREAQESKQFLESGD
ncbi:MAG: tetratricopeptide repeat protein [Halobacteriota archaeon]